MLNPTAETFLWNLFRLGLLKDDPQSALEWVSSLYDRGLDLPEEVESLLTAYWAHKDREILFSLALKVLESFYLDVEHRTRLTAYLFTAEKIDIVQACSFLSFEGVHVDTLEPSLRRVSDVLWLLKQDSELQVMAPNDDSLLSEALRDLAKSAKTF